MKIRGVQFELKGGDEFQKKLDNLANKSQNRVARNTLGAGLRAAQKAIKARAPESIRKSIGVANGKSRGGKYDARVGVLVGKRSRIVWKQWAPLIVLGSKARARKRIGGKFSYIKNPTQSQLDTGSVKQHPCVREGFDASKATQNSAMAAAFKRSIQREIAKQNLNKG